MVHYGAKIFNNFHSRRLEAVACAVEAEENLCSQAGDSGDSEQTGSFNVKAPASSEDRRYSYYSPCIENLCCAYMDITQAQHQFSFG